MKSSENKTIEETQLIVIVIIIICCFVFIWWFFKQVKIIKGIITFIYFLKPFQFYFFRRNDHLNWGSQGQGTFVVGNSYVFIVSVCLLCILLVCCNELPLLEKEKKRKENENWVINPKSLPIHKGFMTLAHTMTNMVFQRKLLSVLQ